MVTIWRSSSIITVFAQVFRQGHQETTMAQSPKETTAQTNKNVVPIGPGGVAGHLLRMVVMIFTGGFIYPNTFVEGMDLTSIQKVHQEPTEKVGKKG